MVLYLFPSTYDIMKILVAKTPSYTTRFVDTADQRKDCSIAWASSCVYSSTRRFSSIHFLCLSLISICVKRKRVPDLVPMVGSIIILSCGNLSLYQNFQVVQILVNVLSIKS